MEKTEETGKIIIAVGSDHGGYEAKKDVCTHLASLGYEVVDCGCPSSERVDYPIYAYKVASLVSDKKAEFGLLICNSGEGMEMAANKVKGIRAALLYNDDVAHLAKEHNNANVICFGAKFFSSQRIIEMTDIFLKSEFQGGRHENRVRLIGEIEKGKIIA